jgi:hypothetical protein
MKHIKLFEEFINEEFKFSKIKFNSHKDHNPDADILVGYLDKDTYITYGLYVKDSGPRKKGDEFMEYYTGANYVVGSSKKSNSRIYTPDNIPSKYKSMWNDLRKIYNNEYVGIH